MNKLFARLVSYNLWLTLGTTAIVALVTLILLAKIIIASPILGAFLYLLLLAVGLVIHLSTLDSGNYFALSGATLYVGTLAFWGMAVLTFRLSPGLAVAAGSITWLYNELMRLAFAHRRQARVDQRLLIHSAVGLLLVTILSLFAARTAQWGVGVQPTNIDGVTLSAENWWVPVFLGLLGLLLLAAMIIPTLGQNRQLKERYVPGQRIAQPPQLSDQSPSQQR